MITDQAALDRVLSEVVAERGAQDKKWGEQNHPDVDRWVRSLPGWSAAKYAGHLYGIPTADVAKAESDAAARAGDCSWTHIAVEELAEAVEAAALGDERALRAELVQLAAVCVQWVQALDRRARSPHGGGRG